MKATPEKTTSAATGPPPGSSAAPPVTAQRLDDLGLVPGRPFTLRRATGDVDIILGGEIPRGECVATTVVSPVLVDADGWIADGALGVLVDEATGFAMVDADPQRRWGASSDITLELFAPIRVGQRVTARARTVWCSGEQSYAECTVTDDAGSVIAHATQRARFNDEASVEDVEPVETGAAANVLELFGIEEDAEAWAGTAKDQALAALGQAPAEALPRATVSLSVGGHAQNPQGNLHGGVSVTSSLLAAKRALELRGNEGLAATSIRIAYARAATAGQRMDYTAQMLYGGRSLAVLQVIGTAEGKARTIAHVTAHPFPA